MAGRHEEGCARRPCIRDVTAPDLSCHRTLLSLSSQCPHVRVTHAEGSFADWDNVDHAVISILLSLGSRAHGPVRYTLHSSGLLSRRPSRQCRAANLTALPLSAGFVQRAASGANKVAKRLGGQASARHAPEAIRAQWPLICGCYRQRMGWRRRPQPARERRTPPRAALPYA